MAKLILINRYYAPDQSATAQLLTDLAERLSGVGQDVHIVTLQKTTETAPVQTLSAVER